MTPLFSLYERIPYLDEILGSYMIHNLDEIASDALAKMSPENRSAIRNNIKDILGNQWKINELGPVIHENAKFLTVDGQFPDERIYRKFESKPIDNSFVRRVEQNLPTMKSIHKDLHDLFVNDVENVRKTKESFANETLSIFDAFENCKNSQCEIKQLKTALGRYKKIQDDVWKHLVNAEKVLHEYVTQRYLWAEFLLSFKSAINKRPKVLKDRNSKILEMGRNAVEKITGKKQKK